MATDQQQNDAEQHQFGIQRIYIKDVSFETPNSPEIFTEEWKPEVKFDLQSDAAHLGENNHEVVLSLTITATVGDKTAFLVEVKQAGIFHVSGYEDKQLDAVLGSVCPGIIFPYTRQVVTELITNGGFPNLYLSPINFDALYAQHVKQRDEQTTESANQ